MSMVHLETAVLVQQRVDRYKLQTLLMPGLSIERRRYRDAEQAFKSALVKLYSEHALDRRLRDELLWYTVSKDVEFELLRLAFKAGLQYVNGLFAIARYPIKGKTYICFPRLEHHTVLLPATVSGKAQRLAFIQETVQEFFRKKRQEDGGGFFDYKTYYSKPGDTYVTLPADIRIKRSSYPFEQEFDSLFSFMIDQETFDGARELRKVGEDWNDRYPNQLEQTFFRDDLHQQLLQALYGKLPAPVVLVAPTGTGKSNLVQSLVKGFIEQTPNQAAHRMVKLWLVDPLRVISGMSVVGQWERRWETILDHLHSRLRKTVAIKRPDILYVDNPVALFHVGKCAQTNLTLAHLLRPYLANRKLSCLLEATPQQWQRIQELDRSLADLFQVIRIPPLNEAQQHEVLIRRRAQLEMEYECQIGATTLTTLMKLEPEFRGDQGLPGSVITALAQIAQRHRNGTADRASVYDLYHTNFHFRRVLIDRNVPLTAKEVDSFFKQRLVGQEEAHTALREVILKIKARLTTAGKPLSSLLLIGPTGVGKTESAKLLTEYLFQRQECLVRIDLNEYGDEGATSRLIGDVTNPNGILTELVRYQRACVLLLDEVEKAHPKVHDLLLQLLDDGRLTDALGRTTDFTQTVVVMTSNLGAKAASKQLGFTAAGGNAAATYRQSVERFFRPEFLNRIERQVPFRSLTQGHMKQLASLHLGKLIQRDGFVRRNTILNLERDALDRLSERGFDPQLGARALKRYMERRITGLTAHVLANLNGTDPIILRLYMDGDQLQCGVQALKYATIQTKEKPVPFSLEQYQDLLIHLREMDRRILELPDQESHSFAWTLSAKIRDVIEPLQSFIWDYEERLQTRHMQVKMVFQIKSGRLAKAAWCSMHFNPGDLFAQSDIRDYLNSLRQQGDSCFDKDQMYQTQLVTELQWLQIGCQGLIDQTSMQGCFVIRSLLPGQGTRLVQYLAANFIRMISDVGVVERQDMIEDTLTIQYQGPGVTQLIELEQGIHLFIEDNNSQVPIAVIATESDIPADQLPIPDTIVRLYALPSPSAGQNDDTVTDLRSGMISGSQLSLEDLKLMVIKSVPPSPMVTSPEALEGE